MYIKKRNLIGGAGAAAATASYGNELITNYVNLENVPFLSEAEANREIYRGLQEKLEEIIADFEGSANDLVNLSKTIKKIQLALYVKNFLKENRFLPYVLGSLDNLTKIPFLDQGIPNIDSILQEIGTQIVEYEGSEIKLNEGVTPEVISAHTKVSDPRVLKKNKLIYILSHGTFSNTENDSLIFDLPDNIDLITNTSLGFLPDEKCSYDRKFKDLLVNYGTKAYFDKRLQQKLLPEQNIRPGMASATREAVRERNEISGQVYQVFEHNHSCFFNKNSTAPNIQVSFETDNPKAYNIFLIDPILGTINPLSLTSIKLKNNTKYPQEDDYIYPEIKEMDFFPNKEGIENTFNLSLKDICEALSKYKQYNFEIVVQCCADVSKIKLESENNIEGTLAPLAQLYALGKESMRLKQYQSGVNQTIGAANASNVHKYRLTPKEVASVNMNTRIPSEMQSYLYDEYLRSHSPNNKTEILAKKRARASRKARKQPKRGGYRKKKGTNKKK